MVILAIPTANRQMHPPAEAIALSIRLPGYQVSPKNGSYDAGNRHLIGRVEGDSLGLEC